MDLFVVAESRYTLRGDYKGLYFEAARKRFAAYERKILYVAMDCEAYETVMKDLRAKKKRNETQRTSLQNFRSQRLDSTS